MLSGFNSRHGYQYRCGEVETRQRLNRMSCRFNSGHRDQFTPLEPDGMAPVSHTGMTVFDPRKGYQYQRPTDKALALVIARLASAE